MSKQPISGAADETKINLCQTGGREKKRRVETAHDPKNTTSSVNHSGGSVMTWVCMTLSGTGSLVFHDNMTQMDYEVRRGKLSTDLAKFSKVNLTVIVLRQ